ncbi:MAG: hypothetical protein QXE01_12330 [Sulfolobales archaeon]
MGSWVAVEPNGMGLPSRFSPPGLGVALPSPRRITGKSVIFGVYKALMASTYLIALRGLKRYDGY